MADEDRTLEELESYDAGDPETHADGRKMHTLAKNSAA
jgi:hypothetical protein